ncbi:hypothetical protein [Micromonospora sp. NPDC093277]
MPTYHAGGQRRVVQVAADGTAHQALAVLPRRRYAVAHADPESGH